MTAGLSVAGRHRAPSQDPTSAEFNADPAVAAEVLGACLDIAEWVSEVAGGRPYENLESLRAAAAAASEHVTWEQAAGSLDRHPRIGEKTAAVAGIAGKVRCPPK